MAAWKSAFVGFVVFLKKVGGVAFEQNSAESWLSSQVLELDCSRVVVVECGDCACVRRGACDVVVVVRAFKAVVGCGGVVVVRAFKEDARVRAQREGVRGRNDFYAKRWRDCLPNVKRFHVDSLTTNG